MANPHEQLDESAGLRYSPDLAVDGTDGTDGTVAEGRPSPASAPVESRVSRIVLRLRLSIALVSIPFAMGFVSAYLYFDALTRTIGRWCDVVDTRTQIAMLNIGGAVLNAAFAGPPSQTWLGREVLGAGGEKFLRFLIGYAVVVGTVAMLLIAVDTRLDRAAVRRWMTQYLRLALATIMLVYAVAKVLPTQFGFLTPADLVTDYASRNGYDVLWDFMAASTGYTIFCGLAELTGSLLLCFRRTSLLGGLVIAGAMLNVLALNVAYKIAAVGTATAILAMDLALIAPALPALLRFVVGARGRVPDLPRSLVRESWRRPWFIAKLVALSVMLTPLVLRGVSELRAFHGAGQPWFGAYEVTAIDGGSALPDEVRWVRVASDGRFGVPGDVGLRIETADEQWHRYTSQFDTTMHVVILTPSDGASAPFRVRYATDSTGMTLATHIAGDSVTVHVEPIDLERSVIVREW